MITIEDSLGGNPVRIMCTETKADRREAYNFAKHYADSARAIALDTESTGINCYHRQWRLRTFQFGNGKASYVLPADESRSAIAAIARLPVRWIGHNGPHDIRSLDQFLGYETGIVCPYETYIPAHHADPRNRQEGGIGHELKELATSLVAFDAGKWETALKAEFKKITIPVKGEFFKSGPRKGQPKVRQAKLSEGWSLIDIHNPAYIAYAGADPILTFHLWKKLVPVYMEFNKLYDFDHRVQMACDRLQRRGLPLDVPYTERYGAALDRLIGKAVKRARAIAATADDAPANVNIYSGQQVAITLLALGATLHERTKTGRLKTDDRVLEALSTSDNQRVRQFIRCLFTAKRASKRSTAYVETMLNERDAYDRVHASINSLAARTARMSVSKPPYQQLPTKEGTAE